MVMSPAATVLNPVTVQDDQMEVGNTGEQTFSEATTNNGKNMSEERTSDATANNDSEMQVIDDQVLQINVRQDEIDMFCAETVDDPHKSPTTEVSLKNGTDPTQPEPVKPELGSGNIEMVVEPLKEPDTTPEEDIVSNKTVQIDSQGAGMNQSTEDHKTCLGCNEMGLVLESCTQDHGLKLTDCQMYHMGQMNASANKARLEGAGVDQLSICFQNLTPKSTPTSPSKSQPPAPQEPPIPGTNLDNVADTGGSSPEPVIVNSPEENSVKTGTIQEKTPQTTKQRLPSSILCSQCASYL